MGLLPWVLVVTGILMAMVILLWAGPDDRG